MRRHGELGIDEIGQLLAVTPTAVRQHLGPLVAEGLVTFRETGSGPGRRKRLYALTRQGEALFPSAAGELAPAILAELLDAAPERAQALFERIHGRVGQQIADSIPLHAQDEARRVAVVASFAERGFMPERCETPGEPAQVCLYHCPLLSLAEVAPGLCDAEERMIARALPDALVSRVRHRLAGDRICSYLLRPRNA